jgi:hypothetical protein
MISTDTTQRAILNKLFLEAAEDLLSVNGIKADLVGEPDAGVNVDSKPSYVSVLGATGAGIALSSMMTIDRELLISLHPLGIADVSQADLEDWCRELNNQLVGRLKNKLLRCGIVVMMGLPVLLKGTNVSAVTSPEVTVSQHAIRTANGQIVLSLAMLMDEELKLVEQSFSSEAVLLEGAVSLF